MLARQRFARVICHNDEGAAVVSSSAVDDADVGMVERRGGAGFAKKTLFVFGAGNQVFGKELEGDGALELGVERAIDHAHTSGSSQAEDLVVADEISRGQSGRWIRHRAIPDGVRPVSAKLFSLSGSNDSVPDAR